MGDFDPDRMWCFLYVAGVLTSLEVVLLIRRAIQPVGIRCR